MSFLKQTLLLFFIGSTFTAAAQSFSATVIDQKTGESIPYATVQLGTYSGVITNEEGVFTLTSEQLHQQQDSVYISSIGYGKRGIILQNPGAEAIGLTPMVMELEEVFLNAHPLTAKEIIEKVKENLATNYAVSLSQKKIFFRQSELNTMDQVAFDFKKSTIEELNEELLDSITGLVPRKSSYYQEVAGNLYGDYTTHKLYIEKAAELYDKNKDVSMDGLSKKMGKIFKDNVKPNSYLKIKSGIFGAKVQLDSANKKKDEPQVVTVTDSTEQQFQEQIKDYISELYEQLFFNEGTELDFLEKSNRYEFILNDYSFIDGEAVYRISFSPKGKKDFKGTLYVNTQDFAIVRLEFHNVRPLTKIALLGISYKHSVYRGKMLFGKDSHGSYSLRYMELEDGQAWGRTTPESH